MSIRENKKSSKDQYLSEVILIDQNGKELKIEDILADKRVNADDTNEQEMLEILSDALTIALNKLELREKIILLLSLAGKKQDEICKQLDLSQIYVSRIRKKIIEKIQRFVENGINEESYLKFFFIYGKQIYIWYFINKL